jgi:hypothetical protein
MSISVDQRFALLAAMGANIDWDKLTTEQVQLGITGDLKRLGKEATLFVQVGFRVQIGDYFRNTGELSIKIPALKRYTLEQIQEKHPGMNIVSVEDTSTEEEVTLSLATVLVPSDDGSIEGEEYWKRVVAKLNSLLGIQHRDWLVEHQTEFPEFMALLGKVWIDFLGTIVVRRNGDRNAPDCYQDGSRWRGGWHWLGRDFHGLGRVAFGK